MSVFSDLFRESLRPFGSPSTVYFNGKEQRIARKLGSEFDRQHFTRGQVTELGDQATELEGLRDRVTASVGNTVEREGRAVRSAASTAVQQQFGDQETGAVTQADVLDNALKRAKTRVGIGQRGEEAARNQQLKDRLTQVRSGIAASGRALDTQVTGTNILSGVNVGVGNAQDRGSKAQASALGGAAGAFAGILKGNKQREGSSGFFDFKLGG